MYTKAFGKHVKLARVKMSLSPADLAKKTNLSINTIWGIESGRRPVSIETLVTLCNALEISPDYLLTADLSPVFKDFEVKHSELFNQIFNLTYPEKKRIEDIVAILHKHKIEY